jgi:hypothetical protein
LKERLAGVRSTNPVKDELEKNRTKLKIYQFNDFNETPQTPTKEN